MALVAAEQSALWLAVCILYLLPKIKLCVKILSSLRWCLVSVSESCVHRAAEHSVLRNNIFKSTTEIIIGRLDLWKLTLNSSYTVENRIKPASD
jgi:hypothetical protein